jgi:hypothetical protein
MNALKFQPAMRFDLAFRVFIRGVGYSNLFFRSDEAVGLLNVGGGYLPRCLSESPSEGHSPVKGVLGCHPQDFVLNYMRFGAKSGLMKTIFHLSQCTKYQFSKKLLAWQFGSIVAIRIGLPGRPPCHNPSSRREDNPQIARVSLREPGGTAIPNRNLVPS